MALLFLHTNLEEIYYRVCILDLFPWLPRAKIPTSAPLQTRSRPHRYRTTCCYSAPPPATPYATIDIGTSSWTITRLCGPSQGCATWTPISPRPVVEHHKAEQSGCHVLPDPPRLHVAMLSLAQRGP
jgi:hypothetical protein